MESQIIASQIWIASTKPGSKIAALVNNRGQASVAALTLLPLLLAIAGGLLLLVYALSIEAKATAACRVALEQSQREAAASLYELMRLNPTAKKVRFATAAATNAVRAASLTGNPAVIASAEATLLVARAAQAGVRSKQLFWINRGRAHSYSATSRATAAVESELTRLPLSLSHMGRPRGTRSPSFLVIATPPNGETPEYFPSPHFSKAQEAQIQWTTGADQGRLEMTIPRIEVGCAMTLSRDPKSNREDRWIPQVSADKLLSN